MKYKSRLAEEVTDTDEGGPGSGQKGHTTATDSDAHAKVKAAHPEYFDMNHDLNVTGPDNPHFSPAALDARDEEERLRKRSQGQHANGKDFR
jgi:hypothetical protein